MCVCVHRACPVCLQQWIRKRPWNSSKKKKNTLWVLSGCLCRAIHVSPSSPAAWRRRDSNHHHHHHHLQRLWGTSTCFCQQSWSPENCVCVCVFFLDGAAESRGTSSGALNRGFVCSQERGGTGKTPEPVTSLSLLGEGEL